jgi:hypothetical protein
MNQLANCLTRRVTKPTSLFRLLQRTLCCMKRRDRQIWEISRWKEKVTEKWERVNLVKGEIESNFYRGFPFAHLIRLVWNYSKLCRIWSSHKGRYEEYYLQGYNTMLSFEIQPAFRRNIPSPTSVFYLFGWISTDCTVLYPRRYYALL